MRRMRAASRGTARRRARRGLEPDRCVGGHARLFGGLAGEGLGVLVVWAGCAASRSCAHLSRRDMHETWWLPKILCLKQHHPSRRSRPSTGSPAASVASAPRACSPTSATRSRRRCFRASHLDPRRTGGCARADRGRRRRPGRRGAARGRCAGRRPERRRATARRRLHGHRGLSALIGAATAVWQVGVLRAGAWAARGLRVPRETRCWPTSCRAAAYGRAYGFERAMDNLGAIGGPLLALALVALFGIARRSCCRSSRACWRRSPSSTRSGRASLELGASADTSAGASGASRPPRALMLGVGAFELGNVAATLLILRATELLDARPRPGPRRSSRSGSTPATTSPRPSRASPPATSATDAALSVLAVGVACFASPTPASRRREQRVGAGRLLPPRRRRDRLRRDRRARRRRLARPADLRGSAFGLLAAVQSFGNLAASASRACSGPSSHPRRRLSTRRHGWRSPSWRSPLQPPGRGPDGRAPPRPKVGRGWAAGDRETSLSGAQRRSSFLLVSAYIRHESDTDDKGLAALTRKGSEVQVLYRPPHQADLRSMRTCATRVRGRARHTGRRPARHRDGRTAARHARGRSAPSRGAARRSARPRGTAGSWRRRRRSARLAAGGVERLPTPSIPSVTKLKVVPPCILMGRTRVVREHEHRVVVRRVVAPPPRPLSSPHGPRTGPNMLRPMIVAPIPSSPPAR